MIHNTISGGKTAANSYYTTGLIINQNADADVINNIIAGGGGSQGSYASMIDLNLLDVTTVNFYGNDIWDAADCVMYYKAGPSWTCLTVIGDVNALTWAGDNVSADPVFAGDGFHLTAGSTSVIDMGVDFSTYYSGDLADMDYDGEDRPSGTDPDIGADEYYATK